MSFWIKTQSVSGTYKIGSLFSAESSLKFYTELVDGEVFFQVEKFIRVSTINFR